MRWVSMVPSWTETLLECGAHVVGRTRFCIHPHDVVKQIPAVGGTKDLKIELLQNVRGDLLLLDREENPKIMVEQAAEASIAFHATHVRSIHDVPTELKALAAVAGLAADRAAIQAGDKTAVRAVQEKLLITAERWARVIEKLNSTSEQVADQPCVENGWERFPGVMEWLTRPPQVNCLINKTKIVYVIWRSPWMCASEGTFISSVLHALGIGEGKIHSPPGVNLYPTFAMEDVPQGSVVMLSSEPYPFGTKKNAVMEELKAVADARGLAVALVDGESFSWFGSRSLRFLESALFWQNGC